MPKHPKLPKCPEHDWCTGACAHTCIHTGEWVTVHTGDGTTIRIRRAGSLIEHQSGNTPTMNARFITATEARTLYAGLGRVLASTR
jgi:hypothetical protein